jgi:hypothetical protein
MDDPPHSNISSFMDDKESTKTFEDKNVIEF